MLPYPVEELTFFVEGVFEGMWRSMDFCDFWAIEVEGRNGAYASPLLYIIEL